MAEGKEGSVKGGLQEKGSKGETIEGRGGMGPLDENVKRWGRGTGERVKIRSPRRSGVWVRKKRRGGGPLQGGKEKERHVGSRGKKEN